MLMADHVGPKNYFVTILTTIRWIEMALNKPDIVKMHVGCLKVC